MAEENKTGFLKGIASSKLLSETEIPKDITIIKGDPELEKKISEEGVIPKKEEDKKEKTKIPTFVTPKLKRKIDKTTVPAGPLSFETSPLEELRGKSFQEQRKILLERKKAKQLSSIEKAKKQIFTEDNLKQPYFDAKNPALATLIPIGDDYDPDSNIPADYHYYPRDRKYPYTIIAKTPTAAFNAAKTIYDGLNKSGEKYYTGAYGNLQSLTRELLAARGAPYEVMQAIRKESAKDFTRNLNWIENKKVLKNMPQDSKEMIASFMTLAENGAMALPNYFYSLTPDVAAGLDQILGVIPPLDGILLDTVAASSNYIDEIEKAGGLWGNFIDKYHVPFMGVITKTQENLGERRSDIYFVDENLDYNDAKIAKVISSSYPQAQLSGEELLAQMEGADNPHILVGALRLFARDFSFALGVLTPFAKTASRYSVKLAKDAEQNLKVKKIPVSQSTIYNEMESIIKDQYKRKRDDNKSSIMAYIEKEANLGAAEWGYYPYRWLRTFAGTEGAIATGVELTNQVVYPYLLDVAKITKEDDPLGMLELGTTLVASIGSVVFGKGVAAGIDYAAHKGVFPATNFLNNQLKTLLPKNDADAKGIRKLVNLITGPTDFIDTLLKKASPIYNADISPEKRKILRNALEQFYKLNAEGSDEAAKIKSSLLYVKQLFDEADEAGLGDQLDKSMMTLGTATGISGLKQAEMQMLELIGGKDLKIDQKFKFIKKAIELGNAREKQELELGKILANLGEEIKDKELPTLNAFLDIAQKGLREYTEKNEQTAYLTQRAVQLQTMEIVMGTKFDTDTARELMEILQKYPGLKLSKEDLKGAKTAFDTAGMLKLDSLFTAKSIEQMDDRLLELNPIFSEAGVKTYGEGNGYQIKMENISSAKEIQGYSSTVALTNVARAEDFHEVFGQAQYKKAFDRIGILQEDDDIIDVTNFLLDLNKQSRSGGILDAEDSFVRALKPFFDKIEKRQLQDSINAVTAKFKKKDPSWTVKDTNAEIEKVLKSDEFVKRKGSVTLLDKLEVIRGLDPTIKFELTFEEVFNMRKYARQASRDAYNADNTIKGNALKGSSNDLSLLINAKIDLFEKKGVDNLNYRGAAQDFRFAEENYNIVKARSRQSKILRETLKYSQRVDEGLGEGEEAADKLITFIDKKTGLPRNKKMSRADNASGRVVSIDQEKFLDEIFSGKYTGKQIIEELKIIYGEPIVDKSGKILKDDGNQYQFRLPQEGDRLFNSYKNFLKSVDVYTTARYAKELNFLEASGKWDWQKIAKDSKGLKEFEQNLKFGQLPAAFTNSGEGSHLTFAGLINDLDQGVRKASADANLGLGGAKIYEDLFRRMNGENAAREILAQTVHKLAKVVEEKTPLAQKTGRHIEMFTRFLNANGSKVERANNAEEFVDIMMNDMRFIGAPAEGIGKTLRGEATEQTSPILDSIIQHAKDQGLDEKETEDAISKLIAVGIANKATRTTDNFKWQTVDRYKDLRKELPEDSKYSKRFDKTVKEVETETDGIAKIGDNSMKRQPEIFVDGKVLYEIFENNEAFLKKYMAKGQFDKLKILTKLSTLSTESASLSLKDPSFGLPKVQFNTVMSRAAAVYSQRASIRYPLMEMSFSLAKQREAEAVAALLSADGEFIDLVTDIMMTGNFEKRMSDPRTYKLFEAYFADVALLGSSITKSFVNVQQEMNDDDKFLLSMYAMYPDIDPRNVFPLNSRVADRYQNLTNFTQGKRSENLSDLTRREAYHKYVGRMFNEGKKDDLTHLQTINKIKDDLESIPIGILLGTDKSKKAWITLGR